MLTVCNFHYIRTDFTAPFPSIFGVTPAVFENQLSELAKLGKFINQYRLINDIDFILSSSENFFLVTFDDGLKEQFLLAKPILDRHNIQAIYFINSINFIEKEVSLVHKIHLLRSQISSTDLINSIKNKFSPDSINLTAEEKHKAQVHYNYDDFESACLKYLLNFKLNTEKTEAVINSLFDENFNSNEIVEELYMAENQLFELSKLNMLGSHTHSHYALGLLSHDEIVSEIATTKKFIDNFGHGFQHSISYPYGSLEACQSPVSQIAGNLGHKVGFSMERGINDAKANKLLLKRFDCNDLPGGKNFTK